MTVLASKRTSSMVLEGSDRELVDACRRGERDAFRALFELYKDKVYSIALRFAGDEAAKARYRRLVATTGNGKKAIVGMARRLAILPWRLSLSGEPYRAAA